jgi:hypothetical protein
MARHEDQRLDVGLERLNGTITLRYRPLLKRWR